MIKIMNLKNSRPSEYTDIRIDRSSILGNPFPMKTEADRGSVCDKYHAWFYDKTKHDPAFYAALDAILAIYKKYGKVRLFCWCAPKRCHAETIKKYLESVS